MINYIKSFSKDYSSKGYWLYIAFFYLKNYHLIFLPVFCVMVVYSYVLSIKIFGFSLVPRVCFSNGIYRVKIKKSKKSSISIEEGMLIFEKWRSGNCTAIVLGRNAKINIKNSFIIGDNCKIELSENAELNIKGAAGKRLSGITSDTIILCSKEISLGAGSILSWNCYISDSSQHCFNGVLKVVPVAIGDNVWISEGVTCAPGSIIGNGSIVGAKSYVNTRIPENSFAAGCPAVLKKTNVSWSR